MKPCICFSGWRIRKKYFLIKNKEQPKERYLLSWVSMSAIQTFCHCCFLISYIKKSLLHENKCGSHDLKKWVKIILSYVSRAAVNIHTVHVSHHGLKWFYAQFWSIFHVFSFYIFIYLICFIFVSYVEPSFTQVIYIVALLNPSFSSLKHSDNEWWYSDVTQ